MSMSVEKKQIKRKQRIPQNAHNKTWVMDVFIIIAALFQIAAFVLFPIIAAELWKVLTRNELEVAQYQLYSSKIDNGETIRVAVLADLHNAEFGENNAELVEQIRQESPDIIIMAGDMVNQDEKNTETILSLCRQVKEIAPVYYGFGNHEGTMVYNRGIKVNDMLRDEGISVLLNNAEDIEIKGIPFSVGEIQTDNEIFEQYSRKFMEEYEEKESFKLLISHSPAIYYEKMTEFNIDLGICGHYHGGHVQLPFLGGVYAVGSGLFPQYCNGMFTLENGTIFVSRGLGNHNKVPRINNPPELAFIDISGEMPAALTTDDNKMENGSASVILLILSKGIRQLLKIWIGLLCLIVLFRLLRNKEIGNLLNIRESFRSALQHKGSFACGILLFFAVYCCSQYINAAMVPQLRVGFTFEEASKGQNPNKTRFNESEILSLSVMEKIIQKGNLNMTAVELSECFGLKSPFDEREINAEVTDSSLKIATEYRITFNGNIYHYRVSPKYVMELLAEVYEEEFKDSYSENDSILNLDFKEVDNLEYVDIARYLQIEAENLRRYLQGYINENSSYRLSENDESFKALSGKITNFIDVELERYRAFVLEKGLSKERGEYKTRMEHANNMLQVWHDKNMAAYNVRLETIALYNTEMTNFVLVPTHDLDDEFYMSRTKVGVDYFADEADMHLEEAKGLLDEIENNEYAKGQVVRSRAFASNYEQVETMIVHLTEELTDLSSQCKKLCDSYIQDKRNGYLRFDMVTASSRNILMQSCMRTFIFAVVLYIYLASSDLGKNAQSIDVHRLIRRSRL